MSGTFGKFVLPSLFASGAVFTALSLPLVVYGSERVDLQITNEVGVSGVVKDFTAPYFGLSGLISLAVGGVGVTLAGISQSKKQAAVIEQQYLQSQQVQQGREAEIQAILSSDKALSSTGLNFFLDDTTPSIHAASTPAVMAVLPNPVIEKAVRPAVTMMSMANATSAAIVEPVAMSITPEVPKPFSVSASIPGIQPVKVPQVTVQNSISPLPAAQGFLGFMRASQSIPSAALAWLEEDNQAPQAAVQLQDLQSQLNLLMGQIEQLQSSLQPQAQPQAQYQAQHQATLVAATRVELRPQAEMPKNNVTAHRFQPFEHAWSGAPQRIAS